MYFLPRDILSSSADMKYEILNPPNTVTTKIISVFAKIREAFLKIREIFPDIISLLI